MSTTYPLMGEIVTVSARLYRHNEGRHKDGNGYLRQWLQRDLRKPRAGWVIGVRKLKEGKYRPGYGPEDPGSLRVDNTIEAYLVSFWPTMRGIFVHPDAIIDVEGGTPVSPSKWSWDSASEKDKERWSECMRDEMADVPRDSKGRWVYA